MGGRVEGSERRTLTSFSFTFLTDPTRGEEREGAEKRRGGGGQEEEEEKDEEKDIDRTRPSAATNESTS